MHWSISTNGALVTGRSSTLTAPRVRLRSARRRQRQAAGARGPINDAIRQDFAVRTTYVPYDTASSEPGLLRSAQRRAAAVARRHGAHCRHRNARPPGAAARIWLPRTVAPGARVEDREQGPAQPADQDRAGRRGGVGVGKRLMLAGERTCGAGFESRMRRRRGRGCRGRSGLVIPRNSPGAATPAPAGLRYPRCRRSKIGERSRKPSATLVSNRSCIRRAIVSGRRPAIDGRRCRRNARRSREASCSLLRHIHHQLSRDYTPAARAATRQRLRSSGRPDRSTARCDM